MGSPVARMFDQAAQLLADDPRRQGNLVSLAAGKELIIAGDLHGHRANLDAILRRADLAAHEDRILILQEIIHGEEDQLTGHDRSIETLMRALRAMLSHPERIIFLLGNHDLAQLTGKEISKHGRGACKAFDAGVAEAFEEEAGEVLDALNRYIRALPLAARTDGGVLISHSLPAPNRATEAGTDILTDPARQEDLQRGGALYEWTWGRNQTPEQMDQLAQVLDVEYFVVGHKHVKTGWERLGPRGIVLNSGDSQGCILELTTDESLNDRNVEDHLRRIRTLDRSRDTPL